MDKKIIPLVVQNIDRAISARDYADFGDRILVTSYFVTIQGEGPFAGYPSVFLRLAGCNYGAKDDHCLFCDTSFQFDKGRAFEPQELLDTLTALPGYDKSQVLVITGGEPTLQMNLIPFMVLAGPHFSDIQIETNGTQPKFFDAFAATFGSHSGPYVCVSPKASYGTDKYPKIADSVLNAASCLKYVVDADPTSPHHVIPSAIHELAKGHRIKLYVSPMAVYARAYQGEVSSIWDATLIDHARTAANYKYAAEYAIANNCLLSLQTHLFFGLA